MVKIIHLRHEALDILLSLQKILGVGRVKLEFNKNDRPDIRYIISNTGDIFNIAIPYFSLLYGQKRKKIVVLKRMYGLSFNLKNYKLNNIASEFKHLVYSINPWGQNRKLSLTEKLNVFNCYLSTNYDIEVKENNNLPCKLFIIGLFLGGGSMGFVFDSPSSRLHKFYVKIVFNF